ncbi:hypothetical protein ILUMI_03802 [Ignelater luminosus]|uniref:Uncharacterized protein n=1 Tax=Ignelater luminosus TaxID=2038154 RepID=A0A8K0GK51_IGNLU|nr:hypothetical protein ILUMI_03802 [Ignelater luminosus]
MNATERFDRVLVTAIRSYIKDSHQEWDKHLAQIVGLGRYVPIQGYFYGKVSTTLALAERQPYEENLEELPTLFKNIYKPLIRKISGYTTFVRLVVHEARGGSAIMRGSLHLH